MEETLSPLSTPRTPVPSRLTPPVDGIAPKRRRGRPRKTPAPEPIAESVAEPVAEPVLRAYAESAGDASRRPSPPVRPAAPSADPAWQPRVELRRIEPPHVRPETRPGETSDADGHQTDQPEAARARAVTRSGRISRPPLFYGLGGMMHISLFMKTVQTLSFRRTTSDIFSPSPSQRKDSAHLLFYVISLSLS